MSTGFVLNIDDKLLQNLEKADELVQDIGKHSEQTRDMFNNAFQSMATGSLDDFVQKLMSARQAIQDIGDAKVSDKGLGSISTQAVQGADSVTTLVEAITRLIQVTQNAGNNLGVLSNISEQANNSKEALTDMQAELEKVFKIENKNVSNSAIAKLDEEIDKAMKRLMQLQQQLDYYTKGEGSNMLYPAGNVDPTAIDAEVSSLIEEIELLEQLRDMERARAEENLALASQIDAVNNQRLEQKRKERESERASAAEKSQRAKEINRQYEEADKEQRQRTIKRWSEEEKTSMKAAQTVLAELLRVEEQKEKAHQAELKRIEREERDRIKSATELFDKRGAYSSLQDLQNYARELKRTMATLDPKSKEWKELNIIYKQTNREIKSINNSMKDLNNTHKSLINTADQLKRAFALVFSVSQIAGYVKNIARVRGEFELQQRSLQAILQNKDEADRLWQQTVQLAVRSPFQVKELVTYTKQLAAYRVESDKLYDTTKMLADVSAGLGVDMNRLILAYGQVKAANYLRGTELRQFSEAGVNILAELAKYFTEVEGRAVSVGDVFERVSKRMVTFADVEEIFKRITSEGGIFYNMQEVQAETLKGQISNLRDAIDIMLNEIGQKNEHILKSVVGIIRTVVQNWEVLVPILKAVVAGFALTRVNALLAKESIMLMAIDLGVLVNAEQNALTVTQLLNVGFRKLWESLKAVLGAAKAFVVSNPWIAALTLAVGIITELVLATREHNREMERINSRYDEMRKIARNISVKFTTASDKQDRDEMEKQLYRIVELANKEYNMDIKINAKNLDTKELETKFVDIRDKVFNAQAFATAFAKSMQEASKWTLQDDIFEDLAQLGDKASESFTKYRNIVEETVFLLEKKRSSLDANETKAYEILTNIPKDATQLEYIEKVREAYELLTQEYKDLKQEYKETGNYNLPAQMAIIGDQWGINAKEMLDYFDDYDKALNEAKKEFDDFVKTINLPMMLSDEEKTIRLKTAIDKQASEKNWNDFVRQYMYRWTGQAFDVELDFTQKKEEKKPTFDNNENDKQNKLTSKRISLIKEMRREYEQLNKTFDKTTSKEKVIASYTNAVNEAFKGTGISIDDIKFESLEALAESLESLKDLAAKEGTEAKLALEKAISGIRVQIGVETKQGEDKELKQQVEDLFSRYDITLGLEKLGISKDLMSSLFDVEALNLSGLRQQVESLRDQFIGSDMEKDYQQYLDRITDMEKKAAVERTKTYVKYLMEAQREAVKIKVEELRKLKEIEESEEFSPEQKEAIKNRIRKETNADLQKQEWADFQNSEMYTMMFEDLEHYGTQALETLREKLIALKGSLTDLPASEVKEIINQLSKIEDITIERNPFRALKETRKQIKAEGVTEEQAQTNLAQSENRIAKLQSELDIINIVNTAKSKGLAIDAETQYAYDGIVVEMEDMGIAEADIVKTKEKSLKLEKNNAETAKQQAKNYADLDKERVAALNKTKNILGSVQDATKASLELMDSLGVSTDSVAYSLAEGVDSMISLTISAIEFTIQLKAMGIAANSALGIIGWIAIGIQAVATAISAIFKMHDAGLQKQIDKLAEQNEVLKEKFDALSEAVDNAYNTDQLRTAAAEAKQYTRQMISNYEKMKQLEEDKKKTDKDAVKEYENNIKEQREALHELEQQIVSEATAGILDNAADAARGFVDAWYDAFKETGNGLKGLEDNFDEMFLELAKQQATMQIAGRFAKQWEQDLSKYINETDTELTKAEAQKWAEEVKATFPALNDALEGFLGVVTEGVGATGELSGLEKGIAGASEETVQVLSAYANSCRFLLSNINTTLSDFATKVFDTEENSNPMLAHLRTIAEQTSAMRTLLDSVTQSGHPKGQSGIRVFID